MSEWTDSDSEKESDDFQSPKQHMKVPASLKGKQRFTEMVSSEQLETISKGYVPQNTEKNTQSGQFPLLNSGLFHEISAA